MNNKNNDLVVNVKPKSSFSEAIKTIRTNLQFSAIDKEMKIILMTSPEMGDGKSFILANLALAYAQEDKKVLIIDCDLRRGRQHGIFNLKNIASKGYTNLILNYEKVTDISKYILKTKIENVSLIPTGPTPPNPIELLSSPANAKILNELKKQYDMIFLDCPPALGLSDTLVMTKYSDANVVVVSAKKTKREMLEEVKKAFEKANATITGVVLNKVEQKNKKGYGYYGYYEQ